MDVSMGFPATQLLGNSPLKCGPLSSKDGVSDGTGFSAIMANLAAIFYCTGTQQTLISDGLGPLREIGAEPEMECIPQLESHSGELLDEMNRATELLRLEGAVSQNLAYAEIDLKGEACRTGQDTLNLPGPMPEDERLSTLVYPGKVRITNDVVVAPAVEVGATLERAVLSMSAGMAERTPASPPVRQPTGGHDPEPLREAAVNINQELPGGDAAIVAQESGEEPGDSRNDKAPLDSGLVGHDTTRDKAHGARAESIVHPAVAAIETGTRNEPTRFVVKNTKELGKVIAQNRYANPPKTVEIQLDPPSLGKVTVLLSSRGEEIAVKFITSSHETQQALVNSQDGLTQALSERGLSLSGFLVDQGMAGQRNQGHNDFNRERMPSYGHKQIDASRGVADEFAPGNSEIFRSARFDYRA